MGRTTASGNPVLLPEVEVFTDRGNLHGIHLQDLDPRKIQGFLDQSQGPDLNLGRDPEEVLEGIIQDHDLTRIEDPGAGLTTKIITGATATSHSPMFYSKASCWEPGKSGPHLLSWSVWVELTHHRKRSREVFSKYGPIVDVSVVYDQQSRRSGGFAFVYFENVDDAKEAKERANGMELDGRRIRVDFSITKRPHTATPGILWRDPLMAVHAAETIMTEDMIGVMMTRTIIADHTEEVVEEEVDGELLKTGIRFTEGGHLLLTTVVEDTGHVLDHGPTHLVAIKA